MDYGRPERAQRLAAEYAMGTLRGPARRRFEALLPAHPGLRQALADWEARLAPLGASIAPQDVPEAVWQRLQARLFGAAAAPEPWWRRLLLWRASTGLALAALLAVVLVGPPAGEAQPPLVIVMAAPAQAPQAVAARFVASVSPDGRALVLRAIDAPALDPAQALELWAVPPSGAPRSLGLVRPGGPTLLRRAHLLRDTAAFAVSLEPAGGSPTGAPTGPIVSVGALEL